MSEAEEPHPPARSPVIAFDSILRRKADVMDVRQRIYLDSIVATIDAMVITYERLLAMLATTAHEAQHVAERNAAIVTDAWTVVDCAHRFHRLVTNLPGLKQGVAAVRILVAELRNVEDLRNRIQHLPGKIVGMTGGGYVLGVISNVRQVAPGRAVMQTVIPSAQARDRTEGTFVLLSNPVGREIESPIGGVSLTAAGVELWLSDIVRASEVFAARLEGALAAALENLGDPASSGQTVTLRPETEISPQRRRTTFTIPVARMESMSVHSLLGTPGEAVLKLDGRDRVRMRWGEGALTVDALDEPG